MKTNGAKDSTLWPLMRNPWSVEEQRISARSRERHAGGMRRTKVAGTWGRIYVRAGSPAPQDEGMGEIRDTAGVEVGKLAGLKRRVHREW